MRRWGAVATALALVVALAAPGYAAWATGAGVGSAGANGLGGTVTNEDVPTDDTGVVASREGASAGTEGANGAGGASSNGAGGQPGTAPVADPGAEADPDAPINEDVPTDETGVVEAGGEDAAGEGNAAADAEGGQDAAKPVRPSLPDPVFGEGVNEDNLVNPQQKPDSSFIYDTSIAALQEANSYLNNQTVQVTGEVIGDRIRAEFDPGFCWIVLQGSDKSHSEVPVFMTLDDSELIDTYGAYGRKGTTLQVRGIFHLICPEHEGLTDLHADAVTFVEKGSITDQPFDIGAFMPGLVLVAIGFIMLIVFHQMREGQR